MSPVDSEPCLQLIFEKVPEISHLLSILEYLAKKRSILEYQQKVQSNAKHKVCMPVFICEFVCL